MFATVINAGLVLLGSLLGLLFKDRIGSRFNSILVHALGLCVLGIGITSAIQTDDTLCVIVCMVLGTILGEAIRIEDRLDAVGGILRDRLMRGDSSSRFTEGFVNASVLFCVGAMAINGSMQAGMLGRYDVLISKGVIDGVTAITFAAAMGVGVAFSAVPLFLYQGGLTLIFALAVWLEQSGELSLPYMLGMLLVVFDIFGPMKALYGESAGLTVMNSCLDRIEEVFHEAELKDEGREHLAPKSLDTEIEF